MSYCKHPGLVMREIGVKPRLLRRKNRYYFIKMQESRIISQNLAERENSPGMNVVMGNIKGCFDKWSF